MQIRLKHLKDGLLAGAAVCAVLVTGPAAHAQALTQPGDTRAESASFQRDLAITVARALQAQQQNALRLLAKSWTGSPRSEPSGDLTSNVRISDPAVGGAISTYYHQSGTTGLLVTYLNAGAIKGLGSAGLAEIRRELTDSRNPMAAVHRNGVLTDLAGTAHTAPTAIPDNAPALVLAIGPNTPQPRFVLEWQSSDLACPAGEFGRVIERRRYLVERRADGSAATVRQVAPAETRTDPKAYTDPTHPAFTPGYPASFPPLRVDACMAPGTRTEYRNVNFRPVPTGGGEPPPPDVQCWDIERRDIAVSGGAGGRPDVTISPWVHVTDTCGTAPLPGTGPVDPGLCASDPSRPECVSTPTENICQTNPTDPRCTVDTTPCTPAQTLTRSEEQRMTTGCWGPEPGIPGGWSGTIHWLRFADFHRQFLAACPREDRPVAVLDEEMRNYRDCAGQNGCRTGEPGRGYFREAYSCTATQYTTTACPPGTAGGGITWSRPLTATLTAGGAPSLSDPPWTWSSTSCARTERQTLSCPTTTRLETHEYGAESGSTTSYWVEVAALSGEIIQERTVSVSGSGSAPSPGGTNASGFAETATAWATVSDTCAYPPPPPTTSDPSCFTAGTQVRMADGRSKPIESIRVGEMVVGERGINTVIAIEAPKLGARRLYAINGGRHFVTAEHPFRTATGWASISPDALRHEDPALLAALDLKTLQVGDVLITQDGPVTVSSIEEAVGAPDTTVYNLLLEGDHTYFADGWLVHNKGGDGGSDGGGGSGGCGDGSGGGGSCGGGDGSF